MQRLFRFTTPLHTRYAYIQFRILSRPRMIAPPKSRYPEQLDSPRRVTPRDEQAGSLTNAPCPILSPFFWRKGGKPPTSIHPVHQERRSPRRPESKACPEQSRRGPAVPPPGLCFELPDRKSV